MANLNGLPYELQSPRWRQALNRASGRPAEPGLSNEVAADFLNKSLDVLRASEARNGDNTRASDGRERFVSALTGLGTAVLGAVGARPDPEPQPAFYGRPGLSGGDIVLPLMVAAVGAYLVFGR